MEAVICAVAASVVTLPRIFGSERKKGRGFLSAIVRLSVQKRKQPLMAQARDTTNLRGTQSILLNLPSAILRLPSGGIDPAD
jgi:hypothetical protein